MIEFDRVRQGGAIEARQNPKANSLRRTRCQTELTIYIYIYIYIYLFSLDKSEGYWRRRLKTQPSTNFSIEFRPSKRLKGITHWFARIRQKRNQMKMNTQKPKHLILGTKISNKSRYSTISDVFLMSFLETETKIRYRQLQGVGCNTKQTQVIGNHPIQPQFGREVLERAR